MSTFVTPSFPALLNRIAGQHDLDFDSARWAMDEVMAGNLTPVQVAGFLLALRTKGETAEEIDALSQSLVAHAESIDVDYDFVDLVGTGGDQANTVNISTMAAIVTAACGAPVVKHGNRAASSRSGTADVLEALGLPLSLTPTQVESIAQRSPINFCFAQTFHPSFRFAAQARKELAVPTVFNILGPLSNPARARAVAIGVADSSKVNIMAQVFARRNVRGLVFRNGDGLDELAPTAESSLICEVRDGEVTEHRVNLVADLGLQPTGISDLRGGEPEQNAQLLREVLSGQHPLILQTVLVNAAAGLVSYAHDYSVPLIERLRTAYDKASETIAAGQALQTLDTWIALAQQVHDKG